MSATVPNPRVPPVLRAILNAFAGYDPPAFRERVQALHEAVVEMADACPCCGSTDGVVCAHWPVDVRPGHDGCAVCWAEMPAEESVEYEPDWDLIAKDAAMEARG